jgi:hypothetical protein
MVPGGRSLVWGTLAALSLFGLSMLVPSSAAAGACQNQCQVEDGDLCAEMSQVVPAGKPVILRVSKQQGTCGGGAVLVASKLNLTWSREAKGPFSPIPLIDKGDFSTFTPEQPGPYFLSLASRDGVGKPDRIVLFALGEEGVHAPVNVQFRLQPPRGMALSKIALKVSYLPAGIDAAFPSARWPVFRGTDAPGASGKSLSLPLGRYQLSWRYLHSKKPRHGVEIVEVKSAGNVRVPLHSATTKK